MLPGEWVCTELGKGETMDNEVTPDYQFVESAEALTLRIRLPALDRLGDTKLEASRDAFGLHTPGFYLLAVRWPTKVSGSAIPKFRRKIRTLEVQIPCVKTTNAE